MTKTHSPLRYPGGKSKIYPKVKTLIESSGMGDRTYVEPFAGGFGIGTELLLEGIVRHAVLNDIDRHIFHFWDSVLNNTDELLSLIAETPITLEERIRQKAVYADKESDPISDGFATLFLNRVNYSGVISGGPIGGALQNGPYKIDCRFNKTDISKRIESIAKMKKHIDLRNMDASALIKKIAGNKNRKKYFFNIDPPYVEKGSALYRKYFKLKDHENLRDVIASNLKNTPWILTYDDCELVRKMYDGYHLEEFDIFHNVGNNVRSKELVITNMPSDEFVW